MATITDKAYDPAGTGNFVGGTPVITADSLSKPQKQAQLPPPVAPTPPSTFINNLQPAIQQSNQGLIQAQTEEAAQRNDVLKNLLRVDDPNSQGTYDSKFRQLGGNDYLKQFTDANTRLAQLQGVFNTGSQKVSSAPGQSQVFEGLQLNEVSRQKAVEVGNQALVVQAMQGNIETARQIALDTTRFASEDRAAKLQSLMAQFQSLDGIVQGQEKQLIDNKKAEAEKELAQLQRAQSYIDTAIKSGGANVQEMQQLTRTDLSDEEKMAIAAGIINRTQANATAFDQNNTLFDQNLKSQQFGFDMAKNGISMNTDGSFNIPNTPGEVNPQVQAQAQSNIAQITNLLTNPGLNSVVGPNKLARWSIVNSLTGKSANAIADIQQVTEQLTLDKLVQAKQNGATFGALSDGERQMLASAASKIGSWAIKNKDGKVTGYNASEKDFRAELDRINNFAKLDYVLKGGKPEDVGAMAMPDGTIWTTNSNGTKTQLSGQSFNSAGNASASNQVKGMMEKAPRLPLLNIDGNPKTPNVLLNKAYPPGSYPTGKPGQLGNQCGYFVRSIVEKQGLTYPRLGDTLSAKMATVQKYGVPINQARNGSVVITNESKSTGHVLYAGLVTKDGIYAAESNYRLDGRVGYGRFIPFSSGKIIGIINPTRA